MKTKVLLAVLLAMFIGQASAADDWSSLPKKKQTKLGLYMTPAQANAHMQENSQKTLFLDVRTRAEVNFLGTPTVADANIPYMKLNEWYAWNDKKGSFKMEVNSEFEGEVARRMETKGLSKDDTVIVICRSGSRSSKAADLLATLGYTKVYSIVEGYEGDKAKTGVQKGQRVVNGWKNSGMPWSYKLAKEKMYLAEAEM
ncbi:MAG: rhodanese-like domain-containing protein [Gammaproteobacteria bacterium]|nr:rhodanese-like domain-containing protein [Gammaproteobacteria bacterium]